MADVNATNVPHQLAVALGTTDFVGGLVASLIFLCLCMFPTLFFCSRFSKDPVLPSAFIGFMTMGVTVGLGWLPAWLMIIVSLVIALLFSGAIRGWITGRSGEG